MSSLFSRLDAAGAAVAAIDAGVIYELGAKYALDGGLQVGAGHEAPALEAFAPELIYISAGFDGHREDDMGNLALVEGDYTWVTQQIMAVAQRHCRGRVISCLEGGYALSALARSAAAHVKVLMDAD